ncbi:hypothetical protein ACIOKA_37930 [Streptomyces anulatus]
MTDPASIIQRIMTGPLGSEIHEAREWALTITNSDKLELFLNPADAKGLEGCELFSLPIRQSIGVPVGRALIFDHRSGKYIRKNETPDWTS